MPYSKQTFTYEGGARTFTISLALGYIDEADIQVYVTGELGGSGEQLYRTFTFDSEFVVNVTEALDNPSTVTVERTVAPDVFKIDFEQGADITNRNVMIAFRHNFHLMQEILDGRVDGIDIDQRAADAEAAAVAAIAAQAAAEAAAEGIAADEIILRDGSVAMTAALDLDGVTPTEDQHAASKKYVDDTAGGGGVMLLDGSQQMTGLMSLKAGTPPTDADHAVNKTYSDLKATLASPTFTGVPAAPTAAPATDTTQIATTAFVLANGGGGSVDVQTFTASGTWTKPSGARFVYVELTGSGASGGKSGSGDGGGGGGGGSWWAGWLNADDLAATETITVGAGAVGVSSNGNGNHGSPSWFADPPLLIGYGGGRGLQNTGAGGYGGMRNAGWHGTGMKSHAGNGGAGVLGGAGNNGQWCLYGGAGGGGGGEITSGGTGGTSQFGGDGGDGSTGSGSPTAGSIPGGGGGGIESATTSGAGADGLVTVWTI